MNNTIGLETLEKVIGRDEFSLFNYEMRIDEDFKTYLEGHDEFVSPVFSVSTVSSGFEWNRVQVILISAVGASGKSWLSERLSVDLMSPVINLGRMNVVASYSLTGLLNDRLGPRFAAEYMENLQLGKMGLIIDALDEGYQKTNTEGYFNFLDDVIGKVPDQGARPIVLLGRTNAVELAALHIEERGVSCAILTIEPFTILQAKEFIDKRIRKSKKENEIYNQTYKELRDYIIDAIGCFFKNQGDIGHQKKSFIGYAPVLLAISDYIKGVNNYQKEIISLQQSHNRSVSLIIDIVERILIRDKKEKIDVSLLSTITKNRDQEFQNRVLATAYLPKEQCARVLYMMLGKPYTLSPIEDEDFNMRYKNKINEWIQEHPFLNGHKPANIVFESYVLAKLAMDTEYKRDVYDYLAKHNNNSYIFFYIFNELNKGTIIDLAIVPYLYSSLCALEAKNYRHSLDALIMNTKIDDENLYFKVDFDDAAVTADDNYEYTAIANSDDELKMGYCISNINIDIPLSVSFNMPKTELISPVYISCKTLFVCSNEIIINSQVDDSGIIIETGNINPRTSNGMLPSIRTFSDKSDLKILCPTSLPFPFSDYQTSELGQQISVLSEKEKEFYKKMRKTLIMFRSHSKGKLAKCCSKIDNRIGSKDSGRPVLEALLEKHILYKEGIMYFIDLEAMDKYLGVSFDGIKECVINDKIRSFVSSISER